MPRLLPNLRYLLAAGHTLQSAGASLGISKSTAFRWIDRYGMDADGGRRTKPRVSLSDRALIRALRRRGISVRQTAAQVAVGRATVRRVAEEIPTSYRCHGCGGKVLSGPCRACALR